MNDREVFICDDEVAILEVVGLIVESSGAKAIVEADSSKLYALLDNGNPKLLIIDLWMPNLSGDDVIRTLKNQERYKDLYILCISASRDGKEVALEAGADQFLAKPFDVDDILEVVSDVVLKK